MEWLIKAGGLDAKGQEWYNALHKIDLEFNDPKIKVDVNQEMVNVAQAVYEKFKANVVMERQTAFKSSDDIGKANGNTWNPNMDGSI